MYAYTKKRKKTCVDTQIPTAAEGRWVYVYTRIHVYTCIQVYRNIYIYIYAFTKTCKRTCVHTQTYTVADGRRVLQCVAERCGVLQYVAVIVLRGGAHT